MMDEQGWDEEIIRQKVEAYHAAHREQSMTAPSGKSFSFAELTAGTERKARKRANNALYEVGLKYHDGLALVIIDDILQCNGFAPMQAAIYWEGDGQCHEQVGPRTWITLAWHRMESGRYEIVVYLN